jgi:SAM-dependent methyltransferase
MPKRESGFYEDPVVYDILHSPDTGEDYRVLERLFERHLSKKRREGSWLEPACGSGRFLRACATHGRRIVGFDQSQEMVTYARRRLARLGLNRRARVFAASMESFSSRMKPSSVAFAFNTINTIRHLETDEAFLRHFAGISRVLIPGGVYLVGMSLSAYGEEEPSEDAWEGRRGRCRVQQLVQYLPPVAHGPQSRVEQVLSHLTIQRPSGTQHRNDRYGLRCYDKRQWRALIRKSALEILEVTSDAGEPLKDFNGSYFLYLLQRKRGIRTG